MSSFRDALVALLPNLRRFALALTGSAQDGEDLVHSAVERALRHEASWQPQSRLDSWMFRIMQNLWIDELRAKRRQNVPLDSVPELSAGDGRDSAARLDLDDALRALQALPAEQRAVFCLVVIEGQSYRDTAEALDIPIGTVMSRLARARAAVASRLSAEPSRIGSLSS